MIITIEITFLIYFGLIQSQVSLSGKQFYKKLTPNVEKENSFLKSQEEKICHGSSQHFYQPLVQNTLGAERLKTFFQFPESLTKADSLPALLGFKMNNLRIPYDEIRRGWPPKDGIPAIDRPKFITASSANFLHDEDYVLGIEIEGLAKAYPIRILNYHEIVNDWFGDIPLVVTYCPLCGSGAAFLAHIDGEYYTFGVSGLLYNSDVLLYDRKTESLWSQIMGEGISGIASGKQLELIPMSHTTWENWRTQHPNTKVLSTDTGFARDYSKTPYTRYENTDDLMFPVSQQKPIFKNKEKVIGIEIDGKFKAYPFSKLKKIKGDLADKFNGKDLIIKFDKASQSAKILNAKGEELPTITLYWFAWYAFHPKTEFYK